MVLRKVLDMNSTSVTSDFEPERVRQGRKIHDLCSAISRAGMKRSQAKLAIVGLSTGAANFIRAIGDKEDMTLSDVAKILRVETATLSTLAVRMERDGLLEREAAPHDKRAMILRLTPRARELGKQAEQITRIELTDLTHGISEAEQAQLAGLLGRVLQNIDK